MDRKDFAVGFIAVVISSLVVPSARADTIETPEAAARQWLSIVDGADYTKSWGRAGDTLKQRITTQDWQNKVGPVREPLGSIMERRFLNVTVSGTMPGLPDGHYVVLQFNSRFAGKAKAIETVELDLDNGRWAVLGYFIS